MLINHIKLINHIILIIPGRGAAQGAVFGVWRGRARLPAVQVPDGGARRVPVPRQGHVAVRHQDRRPRGQAQGDQAGTKGHNAP